MDNSMIGNTNDKSDKSKITKQNSNNLTVNSANLGDNDNKSNDNFLRPDLNIDYSNNKYIPPPRKSKLIKNLKKISSSVSRSFGDRIAHKYGGLITEPDIRIYEFNEQDCFVIWASDGIWSMLDNNEVTNILSKKLLDSHNKPICNDLNKLCKKLVNTANAVWNDECEGYTDDITAVIARIGKRNLLYPDEQEDVINEDDDDDEFEVNNDNLFVDIDAV